MKAAQINAYGGKEVLIVNTDVVRPTPAADEVLVEVYAAAVNPFDGKVREGYARQMAELEFPATLGGDVAGTVAEIGADVTGFEVGQAVFGAANALGGHGSYAEFTPVKASALAAKPKSADYDTAAAAVLAGVSAYQALIDHMKLGAGQKILVHGGSGGIGSVAVQIAKHIGAYVATTVSQANVDYAKSLGVDEVIDYGSRDFTTLARDYDAVFDTVGGETYTKSFEVLKPGGILVSMVMPLDDELSKKYGVTALYQFTQTNAERLKAIAEMIDNGVFKINVDKVFPLDEAAEALEYMRTGHPRGKVVIRVKTDKLG